MRTLIKSTGGMNELLFEKKNKDYGAYAIRATYGDAMLKSLGMVAITLFMFIGATYAYNNFFGEKIAMKDYGSGFRDTTIIMTFDPIVPKDPDPQPKRHTSERHDAIAQIISDNPENEPEVDNSLSLNASSEVVGDTTDIGEDPGFAGNGTGPDVIRVEPETTDVVVMVPDKMPEFPGGQKALMEFVSKYVTYPDRSRLLGNEGTVFVNFVVGKDGKINSYKVLKGVDEDCNSEALRVVGKMPAWKPGLQNGKPVPVMFNLPIRFRLN